MHTCTLNTHMHTHTYTLAHTRACVDTHARAHTHTHKHYVDDYRQMSYPINILYMSSEIFPVMFPFTYFFSQKGMSVCGGTPPVAATCRVRGSDTPFSEGDSTNQVLQVACTTEGLLCLNSNQTVNTTCEDYEIQFECDGR